MRFDVLFCIIIYTVTAFFIGLAILGLYLSFAASFLLGVIVVFLEPAPLIIGLVYIFGGINLPQHIMNFIQNGGF